MLISIFFFNNHVASSQHMRESKLGYINVEKMERGFACSSGQYLNCPLDRHSQGVTLSDTLPLTDLSL